MAKKITIELIIPDNTGNGDTDLIHKARETFHNGFKGNPDYVNSNVVVYDNRNGGEEFTETGLLVDFTKCKCKLIASKELLEVFTKFLHLPEYIGMIWDSDRTESDDLKKGNNNYE